MLLVSGLIEAFVTPSPLPTCARIGIGVAGRGGFLAYVIVLGRPRGAAGLTGDMADAPTMAPVSRLRPVRVSRQRPLQVRLAAVSSRPAALSAR